MKASKAAQDALIGMLSRIYGEIRTIEEQWDIRVDEKDFRPRIEYFHDAIRAFTMSDGLGTDGTGRLSVEFLAYDISMLRHLQNDPMPGTRARGKKLSPGTSIVESNGPRARSTAGLKPDVGVKNQLMDLYKNYAVLFAALLADPAARNHASRINEGNTQVEDISALINSVAAKARLSDGEINVEAMADAEIRTEDMMDTILAAFKNGTLKKRMAAKDALRKLKEMAQQVDKENKAIEQAHFTFATGQLAIYEGAKDVIKKMAIKGMNLVGDFVANAVRDAQRGGRGM